MAAHLRLGVNIDHVATIRNARGGEYWCASSRIDGTAMITRISTGTKVQTTSSTVLWVVRDGTGLAARR